MRLQGKVALITGGGSGIGRATAIEFVKEGARVMVADWNPAGGQETVRLARQAGGEAAFVEGDVSKAADAQRMVSATVERYGALHILHNNAAVLIQGSVADLAEADWDKVLAVNLKGAFLLSKYAIQQFRKQGTGGCIVNSASVNSAYAEGDIAAYCASKGGLMQLTRAMAIDHSAEGIRVNCVCPGWIDTPMNAAYFASRPDAREVAGRLHAINRVGQPEEVAKVVVFLASDDASFVTGAAYYVDGGFSAGLSKQIGLV